MDFIRRKDAVRILKISATLLLGRYSGLVSYTLGNAPHPSKSTVDSSNRAFVPISAILGSICSMSIIFVGKTKHRPKHMIWFLIGTVPIAMAFSEPFTGYALRNVSESDWYKFKKIRSLIALGVFAVCTVSLAMD